MVKELLYSVLKIKQRVKANLIEGSCEKSPFRRCHFDGQREGEVDKKALESMILTKGSGKRPEWTYRNKANSPCLANKWAFELTQ